MNVKDRLKRLESKFNMGGYDKIVVVEDLEWQKLHSDNDIIDVYTEYEPDDRTLVIEIIEAENWQERNER